VRLIEITGNKLLPTAQLHALVASAEGHTITLGQLGALADRVTEFYRSHGYPLARAYVPAQRIENGKVTLAVLEARYGAVSLHNLSTTSDRPLRETLAPLASGAPVSEQSLDRTLLLMSDIPGVIVNSAVRPGTATGTSDLDVYVNSAPRYAGLVAVDDYGNRYTGRTRATGRLDVNSLLGEGDKLTVNLLTSGAGLSYGQLDYRFLLDGEGSVLGASASELYYQLSGELAPLQAHGTAQVDSLYLSQPLIRAVAGNLYMQLQYDHKDLLDRLDAAEIHDFRRTNDLTLTLAGHRRDARGITNFNVSVTLDHVGFDNTAARLADSLGADTEGGSEHYDFTLARLQQLDQHDGVYLGRAVILALSSSWARTTLASDSPTLSNSRMMSSRDLAIGFELRTILGGATCDLRPWGHPLANHPYALYNEPYGSVSSPPRHNVRRALRCHPTRRAGAARGVRRLNHRPCPKVSHDPHGHEEARQHPGAGGARDHGEGRARTNLQARTAPAGRRGCVD
jgi:hemolysin activation/secretion protein